MVLKPFRPLDSRLVETVSKLVPREVVFTIGLSQPEVIELSSAWVYSLYKFSPVQCYHDLGDRVLELSEVVGVFLPTTLFDRFLHFPANMTTLRDMTAVAQTHIELHRLQGFATYFDMLNHVMGLCPCLLPIKELEV